MERSEDHPPSNGQTPERAPKRAAKPDTVTEIAGANLADHIFHASAVMIGVCLTAITVIKLLESNKTVDLLADELLAGDGLLFMSSAVASYVSMRLHRQAKSLQTVADIIFLVGLLVMAAIAVIIAYELL